MDPNEQPTAPEAPDQETMEQIRRRRLAKLGGPSAPAPSATGSPGTEAASASASSSPRPAETKAESKNAEKLPPIEARANTSARPAPPATPHSAGSITAGSTNTTAKRRASEVDGHSATASPRKQTPLQREETIEDYADRALGTIFRVTVDANRTTDHYGHKLIFLPNVSQELADEGAPLRLDAGRLEQIIMEAATEFQQDRPLFDYLLPCWKRVVKMLKVLRGPAPQKEALLKEARRLCFSNCVFALTMPELFGYVVDPRQSAPWLLLTP